MNSRMLTPTETAALRALLARQSAQLATPQFARRGAWSGPACNQVRR